MPNQNNTIYNKINAGDGSPLGENKFVVQFMLTKVYERFGLVFEDFYLNDSTIPILSQIICGKKITNAEKYITKIE